MRRSEIINYVETDTRHFSNRPAAQITVSSPRFAKISFFSLQARSLHAQIIRDKFTHPNQVFEYFHRKTSNGSSTSQISRHSRSKSRMITFLDVFFRRIFFRRQRIIYIANPKPFALPKEDQDRIFVAQSSGVGIRLKIYFPTSTDATSKSKTKINQHRKRKEIHQTGEY